MTASLAQAFDHDPTDAGDRGQGYLRLSTVAQAGHPLASEVISDAFPGAGLGYYETRMIVAPERLQGGCLSFFWIEAGRNAKGWTYGPLEIDIEFLANESWVTHPGEKGVVHLSVHPAQVDFRQSLPFNPAQAYHRYGFLWAPGRVTFTVDGRPVHSVESPAFAAAPAGGGWIMANAWSGKPEWGGMAPARPVSAVYSRMAYYAGATRIIAPGQGRSFTRRASSSHSAGDEAAISPRRLSSTR